MTYAQKIKATLLSIKLEKACCKKAFLYGSLLFSNCFEENKIRVLCENKKLIDTIIELSNQLIGIDLSPNMCILKSNTDEKYRILCTDKEKCSQILSFFDYKEPYKTYVINKDVIECEECFSCFLRGAFLACGTILSPSRGYHTEFVFSRFNLSRDMYSFMREASLDIKYSKRANKYLIYCKESESIMDLLNILGAQQASFDLMNKKIERDIRNNVNRVSNCELANLQKTVSSALIQIDAINKIINSKGVDFLPDKLKETALLRLEFPDISISELGKRHPIAITKSCASHRLEKILNLAKEL